MNKLFWGFFFVFFYFNLNFGIIHIALIPSFVGYLLFYFGLSEVEKETPRFGKRKPFCIAMAVYTGILWLFDAIGLSAGIPPVLFLVLSFAAIIFSYYISFGIVWGISDIEASGRYAVLGAERLKTAWLIMVIFDAVGSLCNMVQLSLLGLLCSIGMLVCLICFLCFFHFTKKAYFYGKERQAHEQWQQEHGNDDGSGI